MYIIKPPLFFNWFFFITRPHLKLTNNFQVDLCASSKQWKTAAIQMCYKQKVGIEAAVDSVTYT